MQVRHRFARVRAAVDHRAETAGKPALRRDFSRDDEQMTERSRVGIRRGGKPRDHALGNDENMRRRLRIDVLDREADFVLVNHLGRNLAVRDFLKKRFPFF